MLVTFEFTVVGFLPGSLMWMRLSSSFHHTLT